MHINITRGNFKFPAWKKDSHVKMIQKIKELEELGYVYQETEHDYLNEYRHYKNSNGDILTITILCS
jgi:hypothetical protein